MITLARIISQGRDYRLSQIFPPDSNLWLVLLQHHHKHRGELRATAFCNENSMTFLWFDGRMWHAVRWEDAVDRAGLDAALLREFCTLGALILVPWPKFAGGAKVYIRYHQISSDYNISAYGWCLKSVWCFDALWTWRHVQIKFMFAFPDMSQKWPLPRQQSASLCASSWRLSTQPSVKLL